MEAYELRRIAENIVALNRKGDWCSSDVLKRGVPAACKPELAKHIQAVYDEYAKANAPTYFR